MDNSSVNGKFFKLFFDILFKFMVKSNSYNEIFMLDLCDTFMKALNYNFDKYSEELFYKFLFINYFYPTDKLKRKTSMDMKQINPILESTNIFSFKE